MSLKKKSKSAKSGNVTEMKRNQSVISLITPQLFSIYGTNGNQLEDEDDDPSNDIYSRLKDDINKSTKNTTVNKKPLKIQHTSTLSKFIKFISKCLILCLFGNLFIRLTEEIYNSNTTLPNLADYGIFYLFRDALIEIHKPLGISNLTPIKVEILNSSIIGLIFGSIQPLFDNIFFKKSISRTRTSLFDTSSIIRSTIALVGLSYCLKKYEWDSKLQASLIWSIINILLWVVLDSTSSGFVAASVGSISSMFLYIITDTRIDFETIYNDFDLLADILWIGSFLFISLIIFGKISRHLFT
ncbi:hypothetical protein CANARDRAFT_30680 [[Candida] arabinofermentans NRRL YB-2248]|uniref:Uncharacterized protein n=1 Tax=[Candida] arabinofermentans NRRL YB-2248 TaxID=983967 RepID=A0A1E4ST08_9ASCO|nr:hypothetical protein CANARDRAFT_30680 [[Candida] arabinofermentans NRRL YB-2248]